MARVREEHVKKFQDLREEKRAKRIRNLEQDVAELRDQIAALVEALSKLTGGALNEVHQIQQ